MNFLHWARVHWDRVLAVLAAVAGAVALFVGWNGASRTAYPAEQLPYLLSGGLVGVFLFGTGATLWLSADLRDEWGELRGIRDELRAANRAGRVDAAPATPDDGNGANDGTTDSNRDGNGTGATEGVPGSDRGGNGAGVVASLAAGRARRA